MNEKRFSTIIQDIPELGDAEEAEAQRQIESEPDAPELTDAQMEKGMSFTAAFPGLAENIQRGRGRPSTGNAKRQLTLRIDVDVIDSFKATGSGWQTRMVDTLKEAAPRAREEAAGKR